MTSPWTFLQTSSQESPPPLGLAISITVPFYDDSFRCHDDDTSLWQVKFIAATDGNAAPLQRVLHSLLLLLLLLIFLLLLLLSHCGDFWGVFFLFSFCSIWNSELFIKILNFYFINVELISNRRLFFLWLWMEWNDRIPKGLGLENKAMTRLFATFKA